jgi:hypothetical protein
MIEPIRPLLIMAAILLTSDGSNRRAYREKGQRSINT